MGRVGNSRCSYCGQKGHNKRTCPHRLPSSIESDRQQAASKRSCGWCLGKGHNRKTCKVRKQHFDQLRALVQNYRRGVLDLIRRNGIGPGALVYAPVFKDRTECDEVLPENLAMFQTIRWKEILPAGRAHGIWNGPHQSTLAFIAKRIGGMPSEERVKHLRNVFGPWAERKLADSGFDKNWKNVNLDMPMPDQLVTPLMGRTKAEAIDNVRGAEQMFQNRSHNWHVVSPSPVAVEPPPGWLECTDSSYTNWVARYEERTMKYFQGEEKSEDYCPAHFFNRMLTPREHADWLKDRHNHITARLDINNALGFEGKMTVNQHFYDSELESPVETEKFGPAALRWR